MKRPLQSAEYYRDAIRYYIEHTESAYTLSRIEMWAGAIYRGHKKRAEEAERMEEKAS